MKAISELIYERGKRATKYLRLRIPADVRSAFPAGKTHITRSLATSDLHQAKQRARMVLATLEKDFSRIRQQQAQRAQRLTSGDLTSENTWQPQPEPNVAVSGAYSGHQGRWRIASGEHSPSSPPPSTQEPVPDERCAQVMSLMRQARLAEALEVLQAVVAPVAAVCRPSGSSAPESGSGSGSTAAPPADASAPQPMPGAPAALPNWDEVFAKWRDFVPERPRSTAIAAQTPWRALRRFMNARAPSKSCVSPALVTAEDMTAFAEHMRASGLAVDTINERLSKVKAIYKIAVGRHLLPQNPAANTLGFKESSAQRRRKRRLPFDVGDLQLIFGSAVYTEHVRSSGQSGEASFWLPLLLFYTGARPEEVAGLAIADVVKDKVHGWYFNLIDRPTTEDRELFDAVPASHRRTLKNGHSIRRVPVAQELIDLGLLRYIDWLKGQGKTVLFPTLEKDWHGKLSGAFSKFFGRYLRSVRVTDGRKVMYSFRHTMKDLMEQAGVPSKYLQRILGHLSGDGRVTDGYGSDVPFELVASYFKTINFPAIPATAWQPGTGRVMLRPRA